VKTKLAVKGTCCHGRGRGDLVESGSENGRLREVAQDRVQRLSFVTTCVESSSPTRKVLRTTQISVHVN
jgi:hypothetical protein